jgi:serine/threonine-protein kinase
VGEETRSRIGKYEVDEILGQGGMGIVYKARDTLGRQVAIKMVLASFAGESELLVRFHQEAQFTANLHHPNIVTVYDWGQEDNAPYIVMEYLNGRALDRWQVDGSPSLQLLKKLQTIQQVCNGLNYAHDQNIVHRDIKPPNIFVQDDDSVKLLDFGIARLAESVGSAMTRTGMVIGSLHYMSPEQANGVKLDRRTDIFSTGVVLYQLLSGSLPFAASDTRATMVRILTAPPKPLSEILANCPPELDEVVNRALEKAPRDRYQTTEEFAFDLSLVQKGLRRQIGEEYLQSAETAIERADWIKAREILVDLLKIDREHALGLDRLREVQQILRRQDRASEATQLKTQAADAYEKRNFKEALDLADEAVSLDTSNYELVIFRDEVRASLNRAEKARLAAERAENSLHAQRLEAAQGAVDEALSLDPQNTLARQLQSRISQALAEQFRRSQVQLLIAQARQELGERRYTSALVVLRRVESIDATAPDLSALLERANQGQEREKRDRELNGFIEEIRKLIASMDLEVVETRLANALGRFPGEPRLLELERRLADLRRLEAARLALERSVSYLLAERLEEAQSAVIESLSFDPANAKAKEIQTRISQALAEQAKSSQVQCLLKQARQELVERKFTSALESLRKVKTMDATVHELPALIQSAQEGQEREQQGRELLGLIKEIRNLISDKNFDPAAAKLAHALVLFSAESQLQELNQELSLARKTEFVRLAIERAESRLLAERLEEAQSVIGQALAFDPSNAQAQQLQARISQAIQDRTKRLEVERYLAAQRSQEENLPQQGQHAASPERIEEPAAAKPVQATEHPGPDPSSPSLQTIVRRLGDSMPPHAAGRERPVPVTRAELSDESSSSTVSPKDHEDRSGLTQPSSQLDRRWFAGGALALVAIVAIVLMLMHHTASTSVPASAPSTVDFSIHSTPAGASVHLEGNGQSLECITPKCALSLPPGSYKLTATLAGYAPAMQSLNAQSGMGSVQFLLTPKPLASDPSGTAASLVVKTPGVQDAMVYVDGVKLATSGSELRLSGTLKKAYRVRVEKEGYEPSAEQTIILAHSVETVVIHMKQLANVATAVIHAAAPYADVLVDGKVVGSLDGKGGFEVAVSSGSHTVQLTKGGISSNLFTGQFNPKGRVEISSLALAPPHPSPKPTSTTPAPVMPPPPTTPQPNADELAWNHIESSNDFRDYYSYLKLFPDGARAQQAREKLDPLWWNTIKDTNDEARLQSYLDLLPQGKNADAARALLQSIRDKNAADATKKQQTGDEQGVLMAVESYRQGYENRSIDQLRRAWPSMTGKEAKDIQQFFHVASAVQVQLPCKAPRISGGTAQVDCTLTMQFMAGGSKTSQAFSATFALRNSGGWVIDQVIAGKSR